MTRNEGGVLDGVKNIELVSQRFALIGHCCPTHTNNIVPLQDDKLWLSKEIHETHSVTLPSGKRRIVTTNLSEIISKACRKEGFEVSIRNRHPWEHGSHITLTCRSFGRKSTMSRSNTANNVHTKAPEEASHVCPWVMHVYYDKRHDRFFIRKNSACSWGHKYHSPVREEDRESNARELGENALKVFKSLVERHAPASLAAETAALVVVAGSASKLSQLSTFLGFALGSP